MTISQRIFYLLKEQNKKQNQLSEFTGISTSTISAWNKRGTNPAAENIPIIAKFFNVSTHYLLTGEEFCINEQKGNIQTGNVTNSQIVGGNGNSLNLSVSISDDAIEFDKILKSFEPQKRAKFLYQVYDLAEKMKK